MTEERGPIEIAVSGHIPEWVAGSLYRTGPGVYKVENTPKGTFHTSHWFDGLAHTHRFDIARGEDGVVKVVYSSRRQSDQMMEHIRTHGERKLYSFGQRSDPCLGIFSKIMATWQAATVKQQDKSIANINIAVHVNLPGLDSAAGNLVGKASSSAPGTAAEGSAGRSGRQTRLPRNVWVTTDNSMLKQVDPRTLEPIGFAPQRVLHPQLKGPLSCAHAQRDPITGDLYNWNQQFGREPTYRIFRVSAATGKTDILAVVRGLDVKAAYIHSFYLSPSFVILCIPSSHLGWNGLKIPWERNVIDAIDPFATSKKCKWFIIDRLHGRGVMARFETEAGFFFHTVNAFEERSDTDLQNGTTTLCCDVVEYANLDIMSQLYYDVLLRRNGADKDSWGSEQRARDATARLSRYSFCVPIDDLPRPGLNPTKTGTKTFSIPSPHCGELPTINPRFATRRHRYVYSLPSWGRSTVADGIVKTDMVTREALFWDIPHGHSPGEAIFVPRPGAAEEDEDDGVLLSVVLDGHSRRSYLLCLDARTMTETGRAEVGFAVALGFHGVHVPY